MKQLSSIAFVVNVCGQKNPVSMQVMFKLIRFRLIQTHSVQTHSNSFESAPQTFQQWWLNDYGGQSINRITLQVRNHT